ncbi:thermonuclease family protein [Chloroflexota bacterium]
MVQTAICDYVKDGDIFKTKRNVWIRLARVNAPRIEIPQGQKSKKVLSSLILQKAITYEVVATDAYGQIVAEVWVDTMNVNDYMIAEGYI